ncbi:MAG: type IV pilus assembly PilZ [Magnetococcales bacterium]|nr:type IV pilus assembly PilZ [Magnetococcales bacterium]HIJ84654.1 hypothetical protein [Magnetococcales bacterium]
MNNRKHTRITPPIEVSVHCDSGSVYRGMVRDISVSGVNIKISKVHDMGLCTEGLLKMQLGTNENPYVAEFLGKVVRCEQDSIVYQLRASDPINFKLLKKTILNHTTNPREIIDEIIFNPDISLNNLYLPAMKQSIIDFLHDSVKSIFDVFLEKSVSVVTEGTHENIEEKKMSCVCGFNGSIYGNIILIADLGFATSLVEALLEVDSKKVTMPMMIDGFGELANMISGGIQSGLSEEYENISLIPPLVFVGDHCTYKSDQLFSVRSSFYCPFGPFSVECFFSIV